MQLEFRVTAQPNLAARLRSADPRAVDHELAEAALETQRRAQLRAPVAEGRLRASIATFTEGFQRHGVKVGVEYGPFPEFGTGRRGAASDQPGGVPEQYHHGPDAGMAAQPYLRPAALEMQEILNDPRTWRR